MVGFFGGFLLFDFLVFGMLILGRELFDWYSFDLWFLCTINPDANLGVGCEAVGACRVLHIFIWREAFSHMDGSY